MLEMLTFHNLISNSLILSNLERMIAIPMGKHQGILLKNNLILLKKVSQMDLQILEMHLILLKIGLMERVIQIEKLQWIES